jgi:hypothetical protein
VWQFVYSNNNTSFPRAVEASATSPTSNVYIQWHGKMNESCAPLDAYIASGLPNEYPALSPLTAAVSTRERVDV